MCVFSLGVQALYSVQALSLLTASAGEGAPAAVPSATAGMSKFLTPASSKPLERNQIASKHHDFYQFF